MAENNGIDALRDILASVTEGGAETLASRSLALLGEEGLGELASLVRAETDSLRALACDNVMIAYHYTGNNYSRQTKLADWPDIQASGQMADGVLVVEGGRCLVVAPDHTICYFSPANIYNGNLVSDTRNALADFDGKANTASLMRYECSAEEYAVGYCAAYSRGGYGAGEWWLPSMGELDIIYANMEKINYALSLIEGATGLARGSHWSSVMYAVNSVWRIDFNTGMVGFHNPSTTQNYVRPVTAYNLL